MEKVLKKKELKVVTENKAGIIAEVTSAIAEVGVNIENICSYKTEDKAFFYLLTNNNEKVRTILEARGYRIEEREVIVLILWNRAGALSSVTSKFKQHGMNLHSVYGTSSPEGVRTTIVFCAENNEKASEVFDNMVTQDAMA